MTNLERSYPGGARMRVAHKQSLVGPGGERVSMSDRDGVMSSASASEVACGPGTDVVVARLDALTETLGIDWGCWSDRGKQTPELRYEVRVFGVGDVRFIERGASLTEAMTRAVARLEPKPAGTGLEAPK